MNKTKNILMAELYACIAVCLVAVVLYETDTLMAGCLENDTNAEFAAVAAMEIATICLLPLALRLFKFKKINAALAGGNARKLAFWGSVRMAMVCLPMIANTLLYYMFGFNVAFGYMAIIGLVCLIFIYPSAARCANETGSAQ